MDSGFKGRICGLFLLCVCGLLKIGIYLAGHRNLWKQLLIFCMVKFIIITPDKNSNVLVEGASVLSRFFYLFVV